MNSLLGRFFQVGTRLSLVPERSLQTSAVQNSVFMKRQKKIDPEVAKQREARRRKRLEKEIRQMQKHSKKPKPVDEMTLDIKSAKNINERQRPAVELSEEELDERAVILKEYAKSRNQLQKQDDLWVQQAIKSQTKALRELKSISPELYAQAIAPSLEPVVIHGPAQAPPLKDYQSPDGDYIDTTRTWS